MESKEQQQKSPLSETKEAMKQKITNALVVALFLAIFFALGAAVVSITWGAVELHGIHRELVIMNDSIQW